MNNPLAAMANAYGAVKRRFGTHHTRPERDGLTIVLANGLEILITHEAARRFVQGQEEARHD